MPLRAVEVRFTNGDKLSTNMAAGVTDAEIRAYYKVGRIFNVGSGPKDRMTRVKSVRILK
jgi:hypothetical protein